MLTMNPLIIAKTMAKRGMLNPGPRPRRSSNSPH